MKDLSSELKVKLHPRGFYQLDPLPTEEMMAEYYSKVYYQEDKAQYEATYTDSEKVFFKLDGEIAEHIYREQFGDKVENRTLLDVGCGEGFFMTKLHELGWSVKGCDFSKFGINKFHSHLSEYFEQGNIYELLKKYISEGKKYNIVNLGNVLEHVCDPIGLLKILKNLIREDGLIRVTVPNDFSPLQSYMIEKKKLDGPYWLHQEHLSYFNFENFKTLLESENYSIIKYIADFPIEHYLMHDDSNYKKKLTAGKQAHYARVDLDLFYSKNMKAYVKMLEAHAECGMGRDIIAYVR